MIHPPPKYRGMPPDDVIYDVHPYGKIRCGGPCNDHYARIISYHHAGQVVTLQRAAMDSFREAEAALGFPIVVTGSIRSCSLQSSLYRSDPGRFAAPNTTAHCRGLAIDVSQSQSATRRKAIRRALMGRRWYQARPADEPWHYSFGIEV